MGGTATMEPTGQWHRLTHLNGGFAAAWDWKADVIMFVNRGGTITYDLKVLRAELLRQAGMAGE